MMVEFPLIFPVLQAVSHRSETSETFHSGIITNKNSYVLFIIDVPKL
jgi:hypothetical protein